MLIKTIFVLFVICCSHSTMAQNLIQSGDIPQYCSIKSGTNPFYRHKVSANFPNLVSQKMLDNATSIDEKQRLLKARDITVTTQTKLIFSSLSELGVKPGLAFVHGQSNAYATNEAMVSSGNDGTIIVGTVLLQYIFDKTLYESIKAKSRGDFDLAASRTFDFGMIFAALLAHEFAHIYQFDQASYRKLYRTRSVKKSELQADFFAGAFVQFMIDDWERGPDGSVQFPNVKLSPDPRSVARVLFSLGDHDFSSRQHHGTPQERLDAFTAGFKKAKQNLLIYNNRNFGERLDDIISSGSVYVRREVDD